MNRVQIFKLSWCKIASAARIWINSVPPESSNDICLLFYIKHSTIWWCRSWRCLLMSRPAVRCRRVGCTRLLTAFTTTPTAAGSPSAGSSGAPRPWRTRSPGCAPSWGQRPSIYIFEQKCQKCHMKNSKTNLLKGFFDISSLLSQI